MGCDGMWGQETPGHAPPSQAIKLGVKQVTKAQQWGESEKTARVRQAMVDIHILLFAKMGLEVHEEYMQLILYNFLSHLNC